MAMSDECLIDGKFIDCILGGVIRMNGNCFCNELVVNLAVEIEWIGNLVVCFVMRTLGRTPRRIGNTEKHQTESNNS